MVNDYLILGAMILLLAIVGFTMYNIYGFMPIIGKCQPAFDVINKCGCMPDKNIATFFNQSYTEPLNISKVIKNEN